MTDQTSAHEAPVTPAVETLLTQLEREHTWAAELKTDLAFTEKNCGHLRASLAAVIEMLPMEARRGYKLRIARLVTDHTGTNGLGRPAKDKRQAAILEYLAARAEETVGNAELRQHLRGLGLESGPKYVSNLLSTWAAQGMLTRLAHGCYRVNTGDARLLAVSEPPTDPEIRETIQREKAERMAEMAKET